MMWEEAVVSSMQVGVYAFSAQYTSYISIAVCEISSLVEVLRSIFSSSARANSITGQKLSECQCVYRSSCTC